MPFNRLLRTLQKANVISQKGNAIEIVFLSNEEAADFFESLDTLQMMPVGDKNRDK